MSFDLLVAIFGAIVTAGGVTALIRGDMPITTKWHAKGVTARVIGGAVLALGIVILVWSLPMVLTAYF